MYTYVAFKNITSVPGISWPSDTVSQIPRQVPGTPPHYVRYTQYRLFVGSHHFVYSSFGLASNGSLVRRAIRHVPVKILRAHCSAGLIVPIALLVANVRVLC